VVNVTDKLLVDEVLIEIKIIEEWGFNIGEDACLFEEDEKSISSCPDNDARHDDLDTGINVDEFIDKIVEDLAVEEDEVLQDNVAKYGVNDNSLHPVLIASCASASVNL